MLPVPSYSAAGAAPVQMLASVLRPLADYGADQALQSGARALETAPIFAESPAQSRNDPTNAAGAQRLQKSFREQLLTFLETYEGSLIVLGCKLALAVPTVQQAWASSGVRAGDRIVAVNGTAGPAEKLLSLLRRDNKKRRLTLVRPQTEESVGWRDSARARRKLFV